MVLHVLHFTISSRWKSGDERLQFLTALLWSFSARAQARENSVDIGQSCAMNQQYPNRIISHSLVIKQSSKLPVYEHNVGRWRY
jgi:hypothetical protein